MRSTQELNSLALRVRRDWGEDAYSPIDIFAIVNGWREKKITVITYPFSKNISGMCIREGEDNIIAVNSTMSYGRQRFTLAHELYHILYENNLKSVICSMTFDGEKSNSEREADIFASYLLMPYDALMKYRENVDKWTIEKLIDVEQYFQISHQAMIYRLIFDQVITKDEARMLEVKGISNLAACYGYGRELYLPTNENRQYFTTGEYIRKVETTAERDCISKGKREELLLEAFRADIVYGLDEGDPELND